MIMIKLNSLTNRQQMILLMLVSADKPQTSMSIADSIGVSSRTIKTEMIRISEMLNDNGAELIAKRNQGYSINIVNEETFSTMKEYLRSKTAHINLANSREGDLTLYLTRHLISNHSYTGIQELCTDFYIAPSTLHSLLKNIYPFFSSFQLKTESSSKGIRITGKEQMKRIAMAELEELNPASQDRTNQDQKFERWVGCEYKERQAIRHSFLKVLRNSGFSVRDSVAHRIAMYLIIARNRRHAGYCITDLEDGTEDIRQTRLYGLAEDVIHELSHEYKGFDFDENEICFLGMYMICNLDMTLDRNYRKAAPFLNKTVSKAAAEILNGIKTDLGIDFSVAENTETSLEQILFPIAAGQHYELDGYEHFDFSSDKIYQKDPVCMFLSAMASHSLTETLGCRLSLSDICILSCWFLSQLMQVPFSVKKLRILTTHSIAGKFACVQSTGLKQYFSSLIESITPAELYEIRGFPEEYYDVAITENVVPGGKNQGLFGYNYEYPACQIKMVSKGKDYRSIYNSILTLAYQTDGLIPEETALHFYDDFDYISRKQVYQIFSERYASKPACRKKLYEFFCKQNSSRILLTNGTAFVFGCSRYCRSEYFDLYSLEHRGRWDGQQIHSIFFICFSSSMTMQELKAMEILLDEFSKNSQILKEYKKTPSLTLRKILRDSLKMD